MDLSQLKLFKSLNTRMHWLNTRQRILAQNVANADTPNYQARDLSPLNFQDILRDRGRQLDMRVTDARHNPGRETTAGSAIRGDKQSFQASPTGNSVILEEEMMKVSATAADYETMTNLYKKAVGLFRLSISNR